MPLTPEERRTAAYQWNIAHPRIVASVYDPPIKGVTPAPRQARMLDAAVAHALHLDAVASALRASIAYKDVVVPPLGSRVDPPIAPDGSSTVGNPGGRVSPNPSIPWTLALIEQRLGYTPSSQDELRRALSVFQVPAGFRIAILVEAQARGLFALSPPEYTGEVDHTGTPLAPDPDAERKRFEHEAQIALALARSNRQHEMIDLQPGARVASAPISEYRPLPDPLARAERPGLVVDTRKATSPGRTMHARTGTAVGDMTSATADGRAAYDGTAIAVAAPSAPYALTTMHRSLAKLEAAMRRRGRGYGC